MGFRTFVMLSRGSLGIWDRPRSRPPGLAALISIASLIPAFERAVQLVHQNKQIMANNDLTCLSQENSIEMENHEGLVSRFQNACSLTRPMNDSLKSCLQAESPFLLLVLQPPTKHQIPPCIFLSDQKVH